MAFGTVLLLASLVALGYIIGGLLGEFVDVSKQLLNIALHVTAGMILAVVSIELLPRALDTVSPYVIVLAFVLGSSFYVGLDQTIDFIQSRFGEDAEPTSPWPIFAGLSIDLASDGIMIGAGATISSDLALLLTLGQGSSNIPGAFASTFTFRQMGVGRPVRILLTLSSLATALVGATIGYWGLVNQPPIWKHAVLAFTAGTLIVLVIEEITPQAHSSRDARISTFALIAGFALFMLITDLIGGA